MGYMTTITILNDALEQIKLNPHQFVNNIIKGVNGNYDISTKERSIINDFPVGNHCNPMQVAESHHADTPRLYMVYQNLMVKLGYNNDVKNIEYRKKLVEIAERIIKEEKETIRKLEKENNNK